MVGIMGSMAGQVFGWKVKVKNNYVYFDLKFFAQNFLCSIFQVVCLISRHFLFFAIAKSLLGG